MRRSIWAQSWASVPPAPGWISKIAELLSSAPESRVLSSVLRSRSSRARSWSDRFWRTSSVGSSWASSSHTSRSPLAWSSASNSFSSPSRVLFSRSSGVHRSWSSQAAGFERILSISWSRSLPLSKSKTPPQGVEILQQFGGLVLQIRVLKHITQLRPSFCPKAFGRKRQRQRRRPGALRGAAG